MSYKEAALRNKVLSLGSVQLVRWNLRLHNIHVYVQGLRFFLTPAVMNSSMFWDITPCSPFKVNRCFGGTCCLHLQDWRISPARNKRESKWWADRCIPEEGTRDIWVSCFLLNLVQNSGVTYFHVPYTLLRFGAQGSCHAKQNTDYPSNWIMPPTLSVMIFTYIRIFFHREYQALLHRLHRQPLLHV
jgi:hypothetical protein